MKSVVLLAAPACVDAEPEATQAMEIQSVLTLRGQPTGCAVRYDASMGLGRPFSLADARLYLSDIELFEVNSQTWRPLVLQENQWQQPRVALLDFENATGACSSFGSASTHDRLVGNIVPGTYRGLRFSLGLPPELNHIDPNTARGPLAEAGMFWTWQAGYKFVKFDIRAESGQTAPIRYNVHLGSSGCTAVAPMMAPTAPCARPNLAKITLASFDPHTQRLDLALDPLLAVQITEQDRSPGCMGDPTGASHCDVVMRSLGLDPQSGQCEQGCTHQRIFRAGPKA